MTGSIIRAMPKAYRRAARRSYEEEKRRGEAGSDKIEEKENTSAADLRGGRLQSKGDPQSRT
jgi:hypothetical protein